MQRSYGWVVVASGMLLTCIGIGAMLSLAVFLQPIEADTGWSRSGISTAATLDFLFMGLASIVWGMASDRFSPRIVVLLGAGLLSAGLIGGSRASTLLEFQLTFGVLIGVGVGSFYAPMMAVATSWFEHRRNLAAALVSAGMGMGSMTVSPLAGWLLASHDWRTTMLIIGIVALALQVPAALLVRRPPPTLSAPTVPQASSSSSALPPPEYANHALSPGQALLKPQFIVLALTHFACCAAHSGPIFHMVSYATFCGLAPMLAVGVYAVAGLSGLCGRLGLGMIADRIGAKPTLIGGLTVQALAIGTYALIGATAEFYALSVVFGIAYGGVMPLYATLVRDAFGPRIMGTMFGAVTMFANLGMALGPGAGGFVFDTFGSYSWLYAGSFAIGLGAVAIALTFRSTPPHMGPMPLRMQPAE